MIKWKSLLLLLSLLVIVSLCAAEESTSQKLDLEEFQANLRQLRVCHFEEKISSRQIFYLKLAAVHCTYPTDSLKPASDNYPQTSDSWAAILQLWLIDEYDFVELLWWKKDDTLTRAFIVALEWCKTDVPPKDVEYWPGGINNYEASAKRFESTERDMRIREAYFVRQNRQILAKELSMILSASHIEMAEKYKFAAEQPTPHNKPVFLTDEEIRLLVERIGEIEGMPPKQRESQTNEIAATIIKTGYRAAPYLVEKITDENPTRNPTWYLVGDIAHALLCEIYHRDWPSEGFAVENELKFSDNEPYLNYCNRFLRSEDIEQNRKNRQKLQEAWQKAVTEEANNKNM